LRAMNVFYGWKMVAAAFGLQFLLAAFLLQAFGAYVAVLGAEFGWSKAALSLGAAIQSIEGALLGPVLGWVVDRFGAQGMIKVGVVVFGLGFILLGSIDTLTGFYVAVAVLAVGSSFSGYFPLTVAIVQWFERKRARALAMMSMGLAVGGAFVPVIAWSMQTFGWRATAIGSGVLMIVVGWPLARVFRRHPEDVGTTIDGEPPHPPVSADAHPDAAPAPKRAPQRQFSAAEALRTRAFWLLSVGHGFALLVVSAVNVHAITHMSTGLGYSVATAAVFIMLMTFAQTAGMLFGSVYGDRFDKRKVSAACMVMHGAGLLALCYATSPVWLIAFGLLHGVAWGLRGPLMQAIRADYFGRAAIGMIMGISSVVIAVGQVVGPMTAGFLADKTGDYRLGFTLLAIVAASGALAFLGAKRPS
jgi:MFS family permease